MNTISNNPINGSAINMRFSSEVLRITSNKEAIRLGFSTNDLISDIPALNYLWSIELSSLYEESRYLSDANISKIQSLVTSENVWEKIRAIISVGEV